MNIIHINAGFNCCPESLYVDYFIDNQTITLEEKEQSANCKCNCLYDMTVEMKNLPPDEYKIIIIEPYLPINNPVIELTLDLTESVMDTIVFKRKGYPWKS